MLIEDDGADDAPGLAGSPGAHDWRPSNCAESLVDGIRRRLFVHGSLVPNAYTDESLAPLRDHVRALVDSLAGVVLAKGDDTYVLRQVHSVAFEGEACEAEADGGMVVEAVLRAWCLRLTPGTRADVAYGSEAPDALLAALPGHVAAVVEDARHALGCEALATGSLRGADHVRAIVLRDAARCVASHEPEEALVVHHAVAYRLKEMPSRSGVLCIMRDAAPTPVR